MQSIARGITLPPAEVVDDVGNLVAVPYPTIKMGALSASVREGGARQPGRHGDDLLHAPTEKTPVGRHEERNFVAHRISIECVKLLHQPARRHYHKIAEAFIERLVEAPVGKPMKTMAVEPHSDPSARLDDKPTVRLQRPHLVLKFRIAHGARLALTAPPALTPTRSINALLPVDRTFTSGSAEARSMREPPHFKSVSCGRHPLFRGAIVCASRAVSRPRERQHCRGSQPFGQLSAGFWAQALWAKGAPGNGLVVGGLGKFQFVEALHQEVVQVGLIHQNPNGHVPCLRRRGGERLVPLACGMFTAPDPEHRPQLMHSLVR